MCIAVYIGKAPERLTVVPVLYGSDGDIQGTP
jgi:hypothetical protein